MHTVGFTSLHTAGFAAPYRLASLRSVATAADRISALPSPVALHRRRITRHPAIRTPARHNPAPAQPAHHAKGRRTPDPVTGRGRQRPRAGIRDRGGDQPGRPQLLPDRSGRRSAGRAGVSLHGRRAGTTPQDFTTTAFRA